MSHLWKDIIYFTGAAAAAPSPDASITRSSTFEAGNCATENVLQGKTWKRAFLLSRMNLKHVIVTPARNSKFKRVRIYSHQCFSTSRVLDENPILGYLHAIYNQLKRADLQQAETFLEALQSWHSKNDTSFYLQHAAWLNYFSQLTLLPSAHNQYYCL